jgi:hypothetical protein
VRKGRSDEMKVDSKGWMNLLRVGRKVGWEARFCGEV